MDTTAHDILGQYDASDQYLQTKRDKWDTYEKIFNNELGDSISALTKSEIFDPVLSTMAIERSNRVMAQLMTGKFKAMSKNDEASSKLMNMTIDRYVIPNASSQFDFLTKCRMIDLYSNIYGNFFAFIDWTVKDQGYIGPDMWLLNIRDVFPQVGAVSLEDSDYVIVRSWKPLSYFEGLKDNPEFKNIDQVLKIFSGKSGEKDGRGPKDKTSREYQEYQEAVAAKNSGFFKILSRYERDRWVDYVPGADTIIRDIDNPQENGELPVVCKYSIPLLDDFMGMGDFERGKSQQLALNGLWNLYMGAVKMSIFPPVLLNKIEIASNSSIKWGPAEKWLGKSNSFAQVLNLTPQGISTFNNTHGALLGALQAQFGTSFTNVSSDSNEQMGKTPQALKMQQQREGARDSADRFYMESFLKKVMCRFANLITKKQPKELQIRLFPEEIKELQEQYPDANLQYNDKTGQLKIGKSQFRNILFDYDLVSGSTYQADKTDQQANLQQVFGALTEGMTQDAQGQITSPLIQRLKQEGKEVSVSEAFTQILANAGTQNWNKIVIDKTNGDPEKYQEDQAFDQQAQMQQQQLEQKMAEMMQGNINQIPPQPQIPPQSIGGQVA